MSYTIKNFYTGEYYTGERKHNIITKKDVPVFNKSKLKALRYTSVDDALFDLSLIKKMMPSKLRDYLIYEKDMY